MGGGVFAINENDDDGGNGDVSVVVLVFVFGQIPLNQNRIKLNHFTEKRQNKKQLKILHQNLFKIDCVVKFWCWGIQFTSTE